MKKIRCAIYTRKSAEEGLEQEFNSLDAQREACAAYVASHKAEGWVLLPTVYEDAGLSGGTLERPGLQRLLTNIDAGLVDQIVVYKVDRLTRSLSDFAKLVERLEAAGAVFVSVTQSSAHSCAISPTPSPGSTESKQAKPMSRLPPKTPSQRTACARQSAMPSWPPTLSAPLSKAASPLG